MQHHSVYDDGGGGGGAGGKNGDGDDSDGDDDEEDDYDYGLGLDERGCWRCLIIMVIITVMLVIYADSDRDGC